MSERSSIVNFNQLAVDLHNEFPEALEVLTMPQILENHRIARGRDGVEREEAKPIHVEAERLPAGRNY